MAIDEALLYLRENGQIPNTIRLYWFKPSSITIGYFERVQDTVNLDYVLERNIPFTRRITGGGTVYHDENGEITYSVIASLSDFPSDPVERYRVICQALVYAIEEFGLQAEFKPVNDIVVRNRKVSGSAQTWRRSAFLQHGTLMYNTDIETLAHCLKPLREKLLAHGVSSIRERVTTLSIELGKRIEREEVLDALIKGFKKALHINPVLDSLTPRELELASKLREKYASREWIYRK